MIMEIPPVVGIQLIFTNFFVLFCIISIFIYNELILLESEERKLFI